MIKERKSPEIELTKSRDNENTFNRGHCEDSKKFSNPQRQKIYDLLMSGGKYSVVQMSVLLRIPDPRSHIRYLRNSGVPISDYWVNSTFSKYKVYFIHNDENQTVCKKTKRLRTVKKRLFSYLTGKSNNELNI